MICHPSEGYYRAYLNILRKSQLALPQGNSVSVLGEVSKPGEVLYGDGIPASRAIAAVGGIARFGDRHHIGIWKNRDGKFVIFSLKALEDKLAGATDPMLEGGDVVIVLEKRIGF